jgi:hypothetical protein
MANFAFRDKLFDCSRCFIAIKGSLGERYFSLDLDAVIVVFVIDESTKAIEFLHHLEALVSNFKM